MNKKNWNNFIADAKVDFRLCRPQLRNPTGCLPSIDILRQCSTLLNKEDFWLIIRHTLSCLLTKSATSGELINHLENNLPKSFPPLTTLLSCNWLPFPILTRIGKEGDLFWLLFGLKTGGTGKQVYLYNRKHPFNNEAQEAIRLVWKSTPSFNRKNDLFILPLTMSKAPLSGSSLALPAALALHFLNHNQQWQKGLYATGGMNEVGNILPVTGITEKFAAVKKEAPLLFLYPVQPTRLEEASSTAITHFKTAVQNGQWFADGIQGDFHFYHSCLHNQDLFFDNVDNLPLPVLHQAIADDHIPVTTDDLFEIQTLKKAVTALAKVSTEPKYGACLQQIIPPKNIPIIASKSSDHAYQLFKWCSLTLAIANHSGNTAEEKQWYEQALKLADNVGRKEMAQLINRSVIAVKHNRYNFQPNLPDEFNNHLNFFRKRYEQDNEPDYILGSLYGTKGQNYGFCGSDYTEKTLTLCQKAIDCFGSKYSQDRIRQHNYMAYANLDNNDLQQTAENIYIYLDLKNHNDLLNLLQKTNGNPDFIFPNLEKNDSRFCWALLIRFLAETITATTVLEVWSICRKLGSHIINKNSQPHPWQLTLFNLGRIAHIAKNMEHTVLYWRHSKELSLDSGDSTILPMCLLPLSCMQQTSIDFNMDETRKILAEIKRNQNRYQPNHFKSLFEKSARDALRFIYHHTKQFFPFNYR